MTKNDKNEVQLWTPSKFDGDDLLPVDLGNSKADTRGRENVEAEDLILPAIQLLQGQSDAVTQENGPEGAKPGKFYHTGAQEVFDGPLRVLLCAHTKSRALFPKEDTPAGIEKCLSRDGVEGTVYGSCDACPHRAWRENNKPPLCSESHNFTALTPYGPAIIRFARTSYKSARLFLTSWTMTPKPLWAHPALIVAKSDSKEVRGKMTTFFKMELRWLQRETVPPAVQEAAAAVHAQVSSAHEQGKFGGSDDFDDVPL
jgi:hypothetical protein